LLFIGRRHWRIRRQFLHSK